MRSHKDLTVYQKAKELAIKIIKYYSKKRLGFQNQIIVNQLIRAISSIGANIAEGYGRHYQKSFYQFLAVARGSSFEAEHWLEILLEIEVDPSEKLIIKDFVLKNEEIIKMLTSLMKNFEKGDRRVQTSSSEL